MTERVSLRDFDAERADLEARHEEAAAGRKAEIARLRAEHKELTAAPEKLRAAVKPLREAIGALPASESLLASSPRFVKLKGTSAIDDYEELRRGKLDRTMGRFIDVLSSALSDARRRLDAAEAQDEAASNEAAAEIVALEAEEAEQARLVAAALAKAEPKTKRKAS